MYAKTARMMTVTLLPTPTPAEVTRESVGRARAVVTGAEDAEDTDEVMDVVCDDEGNTTDTVDDDVMNDVGGIGELPTSPVERDCGFEEEPSET